jgi:CubicO group peptidase (beta-lactamase class C family)
MISGHHSPDFSALAAVFADMVASGEERGAIAVVRDGETLVDLCGGAGDPRNGRPWQADTRACCFSVGKGVLSILALRLIGRGLLDPSQPVASVWPEFAAAGKGAITLCDVMTHRAGLPAVSGPVVPGDLYDWDRMVELLAASAPVVPARSEPVYHNMTYGHLLGEILRRAAGAATLSDLLQADLCAPLQADFRLGLTPEEAALAAHLTQQDGGDPMAVLDGPDDTLFARSMRFFARDEDFNSTRWRRAVIGAGSGHATALGLARIYGETVRAGGLLADDARRLAATEQARSTGPDPILGMPMRFSLGLELSTPPALDFGPSERIIGHWGAGGATALADPQTGLSFGYVTGNMAPGLRSSDRARRLIGALFQ